MIFVLLMAVFMAVSQEAPLPWSLVSNTDLPADFAPMSWIALDSVRCEQDAGGEPRVVARDVVIDVPCSPYRAPPFLMIARNHRLVVHDFHEDGFYLWEPLGSQRTPLGELRTFWGGGEYGTLLMSTDRRTLYDIDPLRPQLRKLWRSHSSEQHLFGFLGRRGSALVLGVWGRDGSTQASTGALLFLTPGEPVRELQIRAPGFRRPSQLNADRVLLIGNATSPRGRDFHWSSPSQVWATVAVYDLRTGEVRNKGLAKGFWTDMDAVPDPHVAVRWGEPAPTSRLYRRFLNPVGGCVIVNYVDEVTEELETVECDELSRDQLERR